MTPRQTALSQLGIPPDSELQDVTLPDFTVGIGFATSPASEVDLDRVDPGWEFAPDDPTGQLVLARRMPGTYALETDLPLRVLGEHRADGVLDARHHPVTVVVYGADDVTVWHLDKTAAAWVTLARHQIAVPQPPMADWLDDRLPAWLAHHCRKRAQAPGTLDRIASVANLLRLWTTPTPADPLSLLTAPDPREPVLSWVSGLPSPLHERILTAALDEVCDLNEELEQSPSWFENGSEEEATDAVRDWLHRRDDLASIAALRLQAVRDGLRPALFELDRQSSSALSAFGLVDLRDDDRLGAVSWQYPDAWWGRVGR